MRFLLKLRHFATPLLLLGATGCLDAQLSWQEDSSLSTGPTLSPLTLLSPVNGSVFTTQAETSVVLFSGICWDEGASIQASGIFGGAVGGPGICSSGAFSIVLDLSGTMDESMMETFQVMATLGTEFSPSTSVALTLDTLALPPWIVTPPPAINLANMSAVPFTFYCPESGNLSVSSGAAAFSLPCSPGTASFTLDASAQPDSSSHIISFSFMDLHGHSATGITWTGIKNTTPPAAPTGFIVTPDTHTSLSLAWSDTLYEDFFEIQQALDSAFTLSPSSVFPSMDSTGALETGLILGNTYFYRIRGTNTAGPGPWSPTVSRRVGLNLVVPIEMVDVGLASATAATTLFERTRTPYDLTKYDGMVTQHFEIVAANANLTNAYSIDLVDSVGTLTASIAVPATSPATLYRVPFLIPATTTNYRVRLPMTTTASDLTVSAARILTDQRGASRTQVYIPLTSATLPAVDADTGVLAAITSWSGTTAGSDPLAPLTRFLKGATDWSSATGSAWTLTAIANLCAGAGSGSMHLQNITLPNAILASNTSVISTALSLLSQPFSNEDTYFGGGSEFELYMTAPPGGTVCVYRAGLTVDVNPLTNAMIPHRVGRFESRSADGSGPQILYRTQVRVEKFSNPFFFFEVFGNMTGTPSAPFLSLFNLGTSASGPTGSPVLNAGFTPGAVATRWRSPALSLTSGDHYSSQLSVGTGGATVQKSAVLWIKVGP